ncbi:hypothetical protein [Promicromonospora sp. NFX87]|uniref:hypothetical protein n=1 Tax=Promicromonospora sp. NFX87 TaxID=3402691 RepID=UPI003AFAC466
MIIDNFGTIKPNPWRFYRPRIVTGIAVDEAALLANWQPGPLMVLPEPEMPERYRDLVERITKRPRLPSVYELERAALDRAQDGLMRAVRSGRIRHEEMRQSGSLGQWQAADEVPVKGPDA